MPFDLVWAPAVNPIAASAPKASLRSIVYEPTFPRAWPAIPRLTANQDAGGARPNILAARDAMLCSTHDTPCASPPGIAGTPDLPWRPTHDNPCAGHHNSAGHRLSPMVEPTRPRS